MSEAEALQAALIRQMTPGRRLEIAASLYRAAWEIKAAGLRRQYPAVSEAEIQRRTRRIFVTGYAGA
jgi:hypothetical protein